MKMTIERKRKKLLDKTDGIASRSDGCKIEITLTYNIDALQLLLILNILLYYNRITMRAIRW